MARQPIHIAAEDGDVAGVRAALSAGVDVNILDDDVSYSVGVHVIGDI